MNRGIRCCLIILILCSGFSGAVIIAVNCRSKSPMFIDRAPDALCTASRYLKVSTTESGFISAFQHESRSSVLGRADSKLVFPVIFPLQVVDM